MDLKVYKKEEVSQPSGTEYILTPDVIDLYPIITTDSLGNEKLSNAEILTETNEEIEQLASLSAIWQKGQDPLDLDVGVRWSEALLGEINALQLMEDIRNAVAEVTPTVEVIFDTVTTEDGGQFLKFTLQATA